MSRYYDYGWPRYVPVAERRRKALREMDKLKKNGHSVSPVRIDGRTIAKTFWGKAWCDNLERYSDYANRLPRGRTYVCNGSVLDLEVAPGRAEALVSGSSIYHVAVKVAAVPKARWESICTDCAGAIDSLVELLQGRFSKGVMDRICRQGEGLFPMPSEIEFACSCPDWASMCKHVAAVLYGIGARLDERPELLFLLRKVDEKDLIAKAGSGLPLARTGPAADRILADTDLAEVFGLDMAAVEPPPAESPASRRRAGRAKKAAEPAKKRKAAPKAGTGETRGGGRWKKTSSTVPEATKAQSASKQPATRRGRPKRTARRKSGK